MYSLYPAYGLNQEQVRKLEDNHEERRKYFEKRKCVVLDEFSSKINEIYQEVHQNYLSGDTALVDYHMDRLIQYIKFFKKNKYDLKAVIPKDYKYDGI